MQGVKRAEMGERRKGGVLAHTGQGEAEVREASTRGSTVRSGGELIN